MGGAGIDDCQRPDKPPVTWDNGFTQQICVGCGGGPYTRSEYARHLRDGTHNANVDKRKGGLTM